MEKLHSACFCATRYSLAIVVLSKLMDRTLSQCTCKLWRGYSFCSKESCTKCGDTEFPPLFTSSVELQ